MVRSIGFLLALAVLEGILPLQASAQTPTPSANTPSAANVPAFDPLPGLPRPPDAPRSLLMPAPTASPYGCAELPEPYFVHDPLLDPPEFAAAGWLFDAELGFAGPHIKGVQTNAGTASGTIPNAIFLPVASLDWTVAPRLQVGYRLPAAFGEFAVSYRELATDGNSTTLGMDGPAALRSRLDFNQIDLDYLSRELSLAPNWEMKWHIGLRLAELYYDSRADEPNALAAAGSTIFEQRFSNSYWGIGPHAGLELERQVEETGLSFVGQIDLATLLGRIRQGFFESSTVAGNLEDRYSGTQDVPIVSFKFGLGWRPPEFPQAEVFLGYNYEYWWNIGKISNQGTAAELSVQEVLLRLTLNY